MQIHAIVEHPDHVCCRYRLAALIPSLALLGLQLNLHTLPINPLSRLRLFIKMRGKKVILQRKLLSWLEISLLRQNCSWLAFDFDDAIFLRDSYSQKGHYDPRRLARFKFLMHTVDAVFAGNEFLAEQARICGAKPNGIVIIPTCINPNLYFKDNRVYKSPREGLQLVWIGSSSTLQGLEMSRDLFEEIGKQLPETTLKIISDRFPSFKSLRIQPVSWSAQTEALELATADIGISWIPDDPWSRVKCGLKVLQYMAAGLPVIANPVGVHSEMIRRGIEGFLPLTTHEWITHLNDFSLDRSLQISIGKAARTRVEDHYSISNAANLVYQTTLK